MAEIDALINKAESALLGAILYYPARNLAAVSDQLNAKDFLSVKHGMIYDGMRDCFAKHGALDVNLLSQHLNQTGQLDIVGGYVYLQHIQNDCENPLHYKAYLTTVREESMRRQIVQAGKEIASTASDRSKSLGEIVELSQTAMYSTMTHSPTKNGASFGDRLRKWAADPRPIRGFRTGWPDLDQLSGGFGDSALVVILGYSGSGKSTLLEDWMSKLCQQGRGLIIPTEMSVEDWQTRLTASMLDTSYDVLRKGEFTDHERLEWAIDQVANLPVNYSEIAKPNGAQVIGMTRLYNPDWVLVDGLSDMGGLPGKDQGNEFIRTTQNMNDLHTIYRDMGKLVIASVQMNADSKDRKNKTPNPSDARGSPSKIYQLSTNYYTIYRPHQLVENGMVKKGDQEFAVDENLTYIRSVKSRWTGNKNNIIKRLFMRENGQHGYVPVHGSYTGYMPTESDD